MRVIIEVEPKEIAALVLAAQERLGGVVDAPELSKSVIDEFNQKVRTTGKSVLLL